MGMTRDGYRVRSGATVWLEVIYCQTPKRGSLWDSAPTTFHKKWVKAVVTQDLGAVYCTETNMFYPTSQCLSYCPEVVSETSGLTIPQ